MTKAERIKKIDKRTYYNLNHLNSYQWAQVFCLIGGRKSGKSYSVIKEFLNDWKKYNIPFYWLRLTEAQVDNLLANNALASIDPDLQRKYKLNLYREKNIVYHIERNEKGKIIEKKKLFTAMDFSTFYKDKGVQIYDKDAFNDPNFKYNLIVDECNREKGERNTFDIVYGFSQTVENIMRDTKNRFKMYILGNLTQEEDSSDILSTFNFLPEQFGIYKLVKHKKVIMQMLDELKGKNAEEVVKIENKYYDKYDFGWRAIIHYMKPTEAYKLMRKGSFVNRAYGNHSNFTNETSKDYTLITKQRLIKPHTIIKFTRDPNTWFTIWDNDVITRYNKEHCEVINMRKYLDGFYDVHLVNSVILQFDTRSYLFKNLIDFKRFQQQLKYLKPSK